MTTSSQPSFEDVIRSIRKEKGNDAIQQLGAALTSPFPSIPTGLASVDYGVLGIGGFPRGRFTEIYGPNSSGKSTLALMAVAEAQRSGGNAAYIDLENALDAKWMAKLGVDVPALAVAQPECAEEAMDIADALISSGTVSILVVDSVAALVPRAELEGDYGEAHMGLQARLLGQMLRKLSNRVRTTSTAVIFINQIREKIGVMFGSPETTPGGRALPFFTSVRVDMRRRADVKDGTTPIGHLVRVKTVKNRLGPPLRETEVTLHYASGFDRVGSLLDHAAATGVVARKGAWLSFGGETYQGMDALRKACEGNEGLAKKILEGLKHA